MPSHRRAAVRPTLLLLFFGTAVVRLWPIARAQITEENRLDVVMASGIIMCLVGFTISGQFVSLGGLEIPYYATMIGVALLKQQKPAALKAAMPSAIAPAVNRMAGMHVMAPVGAGRVGRR